MLTFSDNKAGMTGLDKEKIERIIRENTNDIFGSYAKKKEAKLEEQKKQIKETVARLTSREKERAEAQMAALCDKLESSRNLERDCVHVDMDAFFAAVEMRDEPRLRDIPMAVGGMSMLSTSNYAARLYGVRAAIPGFLAKKLCPQLEIVPGNYKKYGRESQIFSALFAEYDPYVSMGSLDEAYLDLTDYVKARTEPVVHLRIRYSGGCVCRLPLVKENDPTGLGLPTLKEETCSKCDKRRLIHEDRLEFGIGRAEVVREIRFRVEQATGLTCSAGIAPTFRLAKVCSDRNKPNGQFELANDLESVRSFLSGLPIRKMYGRCCISIAGIGRVSEAQLNAIGVNNCSDIVRLRCFLPFVFSSLACESMLRIGLGVGSCSHSLSVSDDVPRKSVSVERSFTPTADGDTLRDMLKELCGMLADQVGSEQSSITSASGLGVKMKLSSFDVLTRTSATPSGVNLLCAETMYSYALPVLEKQLKEGKEIRLLGVRLFKLRFASECHKDESIMDLLRKRRRTASDAGLDDDDVDIFVEEKDDEDNEEDGRRCEVIEEEELDNMMREGSGMEREDSRPICPICHKSISSNDERIVNTHVDECLNREAVKEILLEEETPRPISSLSGRTTPKSSSLSKSKKKKTPPPKKQRTLDSFLNSQNP